MEGNFYPLAPPGIDPRTSCVPCERAIRCTTETKDFSPKKFANLLSTSINKLTKLFGPKPFVSLAQRIARLQGMQKVHGSNPDQTYGFEFPSMNLFVLRVLKFYMSPI